jgi:dephospho-CoA kinase
MIIGLTGGIASGKSTVSNFFKELGVEIVDADLVAKEISEKKESVERIKDIFGNDIVDAEGKVIRERLRERVFRDRALLEKLNGIIHPQVIEYFQRKKIENSDNEIMIFDIPLLYETNMDKLCDKVIVVGLEKEKQIERVILRDGSSRELAQKIISNQMSLEDKMKRADIVIMNNGSLEDLKEKVIEVYNFLKERGK